MVRYKLLLADDEPHVTHLLARRFAAEGMEVMVADDGQQAFDLACESVPDVIVSDFQMPILDGYEMAVRLSVNPATASIPILMLTARGHKLTQEQIASTSIRLLMSKPFSARDLVAGVRSLLPAASAAA
ncbi:MAG: response regulator [Phycisphaeraceae bacterium]|nr:response regulator [Phycisphaeraceae bacterium]